MNVLVDKIFFLIVKILGVDGYYLLDGKKREKFYLVCLWFFLI